MEEDFRSEIKKNRVQYSGNELLLLAEQYILDCRSDIPDEGEEGAVTGKANDESCVRSKGGKKRKTRNKEAEKFPNIAGFCRYLGIGHGKYAELSGLYPEETGQISAAFEDEALNSEKPAALISAYLKTRLGYAEGRSDRKSGDAGEGLSVVFSHDILSDGE